MKHAILVYLLSGGAALAHAGHDAAVIEGDAHWLTTGDHVIVLVLVGLACGLGLRAALRRVRAARA